MGFQTLDVSCSSISRGEVKTVRMPAIDVAQVGIIRLEMVVDSYDPSWILYFLGRFTDVVQ